LIKLKSDQGINNSGPIDLDKLKPENLDPIDKTNLNINKDPITIAIKVDKIYND
jgi:hypothetical protein